jgi:hypothetical protein
MKTIISRLRPGPYQKGFDLAPGIRGNWEKPGQKPGSAQRFHLPSHSLAMGKIIKLGA